MRKAMTVKKPSLYRAKGAVPSEQPLPATDDFIDRFKAHLKVAGLPQTFQREQILRAAMSIGAHFSVEDLSRELRRRHHRISLATIYRTVGLTVSGRIVRRHDFGDGFKVYEFMAGRGHHDHLICEDCGRLIEFESPDIERIQERIADHSGFSARSHRLEIYGQCSDCLQEGGG